MFTNFGVGPRALQDCASIQKRTKRQADEKKWRPIEEVVRLANDLPSDRYLQELDPKLDLRAFVRYVAAQNFLGENDGFLGYDGMNNFYFYRKENSDQHVFIAWDEDNAFWGPDFPLDMRHDENVLFRKAMEVRRAEGSCITRRSPRRRASRRNPADADRDAAGSRTRFARRLDRIHDALSEDTKKPYSMDDHSFHHSAMIHFATGRASYVEGALPPAPGAAARRGLRVGRW